MTRDALVLLASRLTSAGTTVIVLALIARLRSAEELGVVAMGLTLSLALAVLPEAGMTALFILESATTPARTGRLLGALVLLRAVFMPATFIALAILVRITYPAHAVTIMLVAIAPALQVVSELGRAVFMARNRITVAGAHSIVENLAWAGSICLGIATGATLDATFGLAALAVALCTAIAFVLVFVLERVVPERPRRADVLGLLGQAGPFAAFGALAVVAARVDTFLIGLLLPGGLEISGAYYAIARLAAAAEYVPDAVSRATYPKLVRSAAGDGSNAAAMIHRAARNLLALGLAIPFAFALVGDAVIGLLYGNSFARYTWILVALGATMPFRYVEFVYGVALTSAGRQGARTRALAIGVGLSIALNLTLLPLVGIAGTLVAAIVCWSTNCILLFPAIRRAFGGSLGIRDVIEPSAWILLAFGVAAIVRVLQPGTVGAAIAGFVFLMLVIVNVVARARSDRARQAMT